MKFIPIDKMKSLREASKNGDANAIKILDLQMSGGDFGSLLDEFFQPKQVAPQGAPVEGKSLPNKGEQSKLEKFLAFNNVTKDSPDYESFVEDFYNEFPEEREHEHSANNNGMTMCEEECFITPLIQEEIKAINDYNEAIMKVMDMDELGDAAKRGMISKLEEIKRDEMEHLEELKRMKNGLEKKEEKQAEEIL